MNNANLQAETTRLILGHSYDDILELINKHLEFIHLVIIKHHEDQIDNQADSDAKMVLHMIFSKLINLRELAIGLNYEDKYGKLVDFVDPTVIASAVRNIFELISTFHLIYRSANSTDEKLILYNLWVIAGLKYRQGLATATTSAENLQKAAHELDQINKLIGELRNSALYQSLSPNEQ